MKADAWDLHRSLKQAVVGIDPVNDRIGIAKTAHKGIARWNLCDLIAVERIVHDQIISVDRPLSGNRADTK